MSRADFDHYNKMLAEWNRWNFLSHHLLSERFLSGKSYRLLQVVQMGRKSVEIPFKLRFYRLSVLSHRKLMTAITLQSDRHVEEINVRLPLDETNLK